MSHLKWRVDPAIFHLGSIEVRWYGVLFAIGLLIGLYIMEYIFNRENVKRELLDPLFLYLVVGIVVGARLAHCLIYEPQYFLTHPIEILKIYKGGLASHGGILGAIIALYLYSKRYKIDFLWLFSRLIIPMFLLAALIRIGNFFNSEILGKASNLPWAIIFERVDNIPRHPVMLYESIAYFLIFALSFYLYKRLNSKTFTYLMPPIALILGFLARFILEFFKEKQADYSLNIPLSVGQLLSIPFFLIGIIFLIWSIKKIKEENSKV